MAGKISVGLPPVLGRGPSLCSEVASRARALQSPWQGACQAPSSPSRIASRPPPLAPSESGQAAAPALVMDQAAVTWAALGLAD